MSHYISITAGERAEMLKAIGVNDVATLFEAIPSAVRFPPLNLPKALSEPEIRRELTRLSNQTAGAHTHSMFPGAYNHSCAERHRSDFAPLRVLYSLHPINPKSAKVHCRRFLNIKA
jgi:glycine cleavage system pyridoxal-binding protein P